MLYTRKLVQSNYVLILFLSYEGGAHSLIVTLFLLIATHANPKLGKLKLMSVNSLRTVVKITIIVTLKIHIFPFPNLKKKKKTMEKTNMYKPILMYICM